MEDIPLFADLNEADRNFIRERSSVIEYRKNQVIYEEASPASGFYCIVSGRVVIFTRDKQGKEVILEYLHRGKYFGIISLLTGETHSVTAKAVNDCSIFVIKKDDFDIILRRIPALAIDLSQTLSRRLKSKDIHQKTIFESTVFAVFSSYSQAGKTIYALNLALSMHKETHKPLIILDVCPKDKIHSLPQKLEIGTQEYRAFDLSSLGQYNSVKEAILKTKFGIDVAFFTYNTDDPSCIKRLISIFTLLVNDYNYIILDLPSLMDEFVFSILHQSDSLHILTSPDTVDLKRTRNLIERLKGEFHFQEQKIKVIINEYKLSKLTFQQQMELLGHKIFGTLPRIEFSAQDRLVLDNPSCEYSRAVRRISRQASENQIGLALGIGVAYGFCHIGVLKVIEEEKIPIDVISGSSIGAIIAGLWAAGKSSSEILTITKEFRDPRYIWGLVDLTLPLFGFIKGNKLYSFLKKQFGNKTFYDLKLPLKIAATDVKKKEPIILDSGLLADAIMASVTMPGVFRPFHLKGDMLFDGGVIYPVPTEPLVMMGVKRIIAVNVTPSRQDLTTQADKIKEQISVAYDAIKKRQGFFVFRNYFKERVKINVLDAIFSSIEYMQSELAQREIQLADVVLHPDTSGLHWLELNRSEEFAKRGEEEARRNLDKILKVINE